MFLSVALTVICGVFLSGSVLGSKKEWDRRQYGSKDMKEIKDIPNQKRLSKALLKAFRIFVEDNVAVKDDTLLLGLTEALNVEEFNINIVTYNQAIVDEVNRGLRVLGDELRKLYVPKSGVPIKHTSDALPKFQNKINQLAEDDSDEKFEEELDRKKKDKKEERELRKKEEVLRNQKEEQRRATKKEDRNRRSEKSSSTTKIRKIEKELRGVKEDLRENKLKRKRSSGNLFK